MKKKVNLLFLLFVFSLLYLFHLKLTLIGDSDDAWFADASNQAPFFDWIKNRYLTWSGRLFPDSMLYLLLDEYLWIWRILNPLFIILLVYGIVRLVKKEVTQAEYIFVLVILGYMSEGILKYGLFWITGTMNYLWPIALGVTAMIPFADRVFKRDTEISVKKLLIFVICGLVASISNEQVALCMSTFSIISLGTIYLKQKTIDYRLLVFSSLIVIGTCVLIFAPGNELRWQVELRWFPGFGEFTIKDKFYVGFIWLYNQLFVEMRTLILLFAATVMFILFRENSNQYNRFILNIFSIVFCFIIAAVFLDISIFTNFDLIKSYRFSQNILRPWLSEIHFFRALFPYVIWTSFSLLLIYLSILISKHRVFVFFCWAAAIVTMMITFFSPTIYSSTPRTLVVASVLLSSLIVRLAIEHDLLKNRIIIVCLSCLPILNLVKILLGWN